MGRGQSKAFSFLSCSLPLAQTFLCLPAEPDQEIDSLLKLIQGKNCSMSDELMCLIMQICVIGHGGAVGIQTEGFDCTSVHSQLKLFSEHVILVFVTQNQYQHTLDHARIKL